VGGGPQSIWVAIDFPTERRKEIDVTLYLLDKTATRLPESHWFSFVPTTNGGNWKMSKLDESISFDNIILVCYMFLFILSNLCYLFLLCYLFVVCGLTSFV
jgi:hypothetical protein